LQSIVAFPFWFFSCNNYANYLPANVLEEGLPPQFYTKASVVQPYLKIKFDQDMFILFVVFQGLAITFVSAVIVWAWLKNTKYLPNISPYPLFDVTYKTSVEGEAVPTRNVTTSDNSEIFWMMKDATARVKRD
jgi:hypothetical protein